MIRGFLHSIAWGNPYTEPPDGAPRVLAEVFTLDREPPDDFKRFEYTPGGGYSYFIQHVTPPLKQLPPKTLASVRRKRVERRIRRKYPLLADYLLEEEIAKKPDYYAGITNTELAKRHNAVLEAERTRYLELVNRVGEMVVFAQEPAACKERAQRLRTELVSQKAGRGHGE